MGRPEITSGAELKGKRVGVSSFGATGNLAARVALQAIGLDPNRDVAIVTLGADTLRYAGKVLQRPLTGLAATNDKIKKNPGQVQRRVRVFLRASRSLKSERNAFLRFAQKKFGFSKEVTEEAYKVMLDALANESFVVEDAMLQAAVDEAKNLAKVAKPISHAAVVDFSFLRAAVKK